VFLSQEKTLYKTIAGNFLKKNFNPTLTNLNISQAVKDRLQEIAENQRGNVVIYGEFNPFVGSGFQLKRWSFPIDISKGKEKMDIQEEPVSFEVDELYKHVSHSILSLKLSNLTIEDNLHVDGSKLQDHPEFLPDKYKRPKSRHLHNSNRTSKIEI